MIGHQIRIGKLSTNFLTAVSLSPVEISNQEGFKNGSFLKIEKLKLNLQIWDMLRMKWRPENGMARITIIRPALFLTRREGEWNKLKIKKGGTAPLPFNIFCTDGKIIVEDDTKKLDGLQIQNCALSLKLERTGPHFEFIGETPQNEKLSVEGQLDSGGFFNGRVRLENSQIGNFLKRFRIVSDSITFTGGLDAAAEISGTWPLHWAERDQWKFSGVLKPKNLNCGFPFGDKMSSCFMDGSIGFSNDKIETSGLSIKTSSSEIKLFGAIFSPFKEPQLQTKVEGQVRLDEWSDQLPQATAKLAFTGSGAFKNPEVAGAIKISTGQFANLPFSAEAQLFYSSMTLKIQSLAAEWADGKFSAEGRIAPDKSDWKANLKGLSLENFFKEKRHKLGGKISFQLAGNGNLISPRIRGKIALKNFFWGENKMGEIYGRFESLSSVLKMNLNSTDNKNNLGIEILKKDSTLRLQRCSLNLASGENLKITGQMDRNSKKISGSVSADAISTAKVAPFVKLLSNFEGKLFLKGSIEGTLPDPLLRGKLTGRNLSLTAKSPSDSEREVGVFSSEMKWDKNLFQLANVWIGRSYQGSVSYWRNPVKKLSIKASIQDGDPKILFALMDTPTNIEGKLNGSLWLNHIKDPLIHKGESALQGENVSLPAWEGEGDLHLANAQWGETAFEKIRLKYHLDRTNLQVENLSFMQKEGSLMVRAESKQAQEKNPLNVTASMKNFVLAGNRLDGDCLVEGAFYIQPTEWLSGILKSENFTVNNFGAGNLKGMVELKDQMLTLRNFSWGQFFKGECELRFAQSGSPKIKGEWTSTAKAIKEWNSILGLGAAPFSGEITLSGSVSGSLADMEFALASNFSDLKPIQKKTGESGQKELEGFNGGGKAILSKGILRSLAIKMATKEGGKLSLLGQADLKSHALSIETFFENVDSALFLETIARGTLKGNCNGQLAIHGDWNKPIVKGEVKGSGGRLGLIPLEQWEVAGTFQEKEILFSRINFYGKKGSWRFSVLEDSWVRPANGTQGVTFRLSTDFANIALGPVSFVGSGIAEGIWKTSEKSNAPMLEGTLKINECAVNNYDLTPLNLKVQFRDKKLKFLPVGGEVLPSLRAKNESISEQSEIQKGPMRVTGEIDFSKLPCAVFRQLAIFDSQKKIFSLTGEVCPEKPSFQMEGTGVDASLISGILQSPVLISGKTNFKMQGVSLNNPPQIKGELSLKNGKMEKIPMDLLHSEFQWKAGTFFLASLQAQTKGYYTVNAKGSLPLKWGAIESSQPKIDFTTKLSGGNLALLNFLESDLIKNAKGSLAIGLTIRGKADNPIVNGSMEILHGELDSRYLTKKVKELNVKIKTQSNKTVFEKSECKIGESSLKIGGSVDGAMEKGEWFFNELNLDMQTIGRTGIPIQIPELPLGQKKLGIAPTSSKGLSSFSIKITGKKEKPRIAGWIEFSDALFSYPPPNKMNHAHSIFDNVEWDLKLKTGKQTIFQNDFAHARINGELNFKGTKDDLLVNGKVHSDEGSVTLLGAKFNLREATLEVLQPPSFTLTKGTIPVTESNNVAYLQLKAERTVQVELSKGGEKIPDTVTLQLERTPLTQSFDARKLTFRSAHNPNISSEKVAAEAGIGIDLEGLTPEERSFQMGQGIARLLDAQLASPLVRNLLQRTGIVQNIEIGQEGDTERIQEVRGTERSSVSPLIGQSILLERSFGKIGLGYKGKFDSIKGQADYVHQVQLRYPFYKGFLLYGSRELGSKENLDREPESKGGIQWGAKFDFPDIFGRNNKKKENE